MNLPNKLTTARMILVPFLVLFMLTGWGGDTNKWICLVIFCGASITDWLDGYLARKYHLVTNYGKLMDPLADKLLVCSALICLVGLDRLPAWIAVMIIGREFIISAFRLIAAENGVVIAANYWGKFKTVFQMAMIILLLADFEALRQMTGLVEIVAVALTVISLATYIYENRGVMAQNE